MSRTTKDHFQSRGQPPLPK